MLFQRVNRTDQEKVFVVVTNAQGATLTTGLPVAWATGASNDGKLVVKADAAADYQGFIGIAVQDIANNDEGRVQIGGFCNSILLSNAGTSVTINAGDPLVPAPAGMYSAAPTYANSGFKYVIASNVPVALSAAAYASGIIRM